MNYFALPSTCHDQIVGSVEDKDICSNTEADIKIKILTFSKRILAPFFHDNRRGNGESNPQHHGDTNQKCKSKVSSIKKNILFKNFHVNIAYLLLLRNHKFLNSLVLSTFLLVSSIFLMHRFLYISHCV